MLRKINIVPQDVMLEPPNMVRMLQQKVLIPLHPQFISQMEANSTSVGPKMVFRVTKYKKRAQFVGVPPSPLNPLCKISHKMSKLSYNKTEVWVNYNEAPKRIIAYVRSQ